MEFLGSDRIKFNQTLSPVRLTTVQRNALTGVANGDVILNTDLDRLQYYSSGQWVTIPTEDDSFINALIFG